MGWNNKGAELLIPDNTDADTALSRTTHLAIGAHQDDLEIGAIQAIGECYNKPDKWFTGVTVTNGSGSPRAGQYAEFNDDQMMAVRKQEQRDAAIIGKYSAQFQLDYPSADIKSGKDGSRAKKHDELAQEIYQILLKTQPEVLCVHNPFDKHETHSAVTRATLEAVRMLPPEQQPKQLLGYEVWRGLDWMADDKKIILDVSEYIPLQQQLVDCFDSQTTGGKDYTRATVGRQADHATFRESHCVDTATHASYMVDLTPLMTDPSLTLEKFTSDYTNAFADTIRKRNEQYQLHDIKPGTQMAHAAANQLFEQINLAHHSRA